MQFSKIEPPYTSKDGCRLVWKGVDEDDLDTVILNKKELDQLIEILKQHSTGKVELEDQVSSVLINSDVTQFNLKDHDLLEVKTSELEKQILDYAQIPHEPQYVQIHFKEFYPSITIRKDESESSPEKQSTEQSLLQALLSTSKKKPQELSPTDLFRIFSTRRSTRKFAKTEVESWMIEKILASADTAPTAGNFQGLKVFYVKNKKIKEALVEAFCMDPSRVTMNFPPEILAKFSLQDATLAAGFSLLAASGLGLSSIWIGMFDEEKVKSILGTDLKPSSILCIGHPEKRRPPKTRRKLKELIQVIE
jgi:nitroreductase